MADHVAVLRKLRASFAGPSLYNAAKVAALDHAIAAIKERDKLRAELSVRGDYVNEALADKYAALVARLGELEKGFRGKAAANYALNNIAATTIANTIAARADDLARVVKEAG